MQFQQAQISGLFSVTVLKTISKTLVHCPCEGEKTNSYKKRTFSSSQVLCL